jgi:NAD(P)-dependent dehydrogenase (short-subunit alcohol dehydrogenase family)
MNEQSWKMAAGLTVAGIGAAAWLARGRRYSFRDRVVAITGGSRGLGLVMARRLAAEGARLALLARDEEELAAAVVELEARHAHVLGITTDIQSRPEVDSAIEQAVEHFGRLDVLINNAGIIQVGPLEHMTLHDFDEAMAIHFYGPLYACLAAVPHMCRQGGGRIVNISSIGGKIAVPHLLPYCASKFALAGLSEGLRLELRRHGIFVTSAFPWLMRTGSPPNARFKGRHRAEYAWFAIGDALPLVSQSPERAARRILDACRLGRAQVVPALPARLATLAHECFPGLTASINAAIARALPAPLEHRSTRLFNGWESGSAWAPSVLTALSDRATVRNNQMRPASP